LVGVVSRIIESTSDKTLKHVQQRLKHKLSPLFPTLSRFVGRSSSWCWCSLLLLGPSMMSRHHLCNP